MKVAGFTIIRNAVKCDYPVVESITSVLPLCDEFIVAVGDSEDDTLGLIRSIRSDKIKIIETSWEKKSDNAHTFAQQTNIAFQTVSADADWAFYIQADEALHEKYIPVVKESMLQHLRNPAVEGLLFNYLHFYGSYDYVGESWRWYRREIRVVRNNKNIFSYGDAQGFRMKPNRKLNVKLIPASIYHYGWVKPPAVMQVKCREWESYYDREHVISEETEFDYSQVDALQLFDGEHPAPLKARIASINWTFNFDVTKKKYSAKEKIKRLISRIIGYRIGEYKNYKLINH